VVDYASAFSLAADKSKASLVEDDDRLASRGKRLESYLLQWMHQVLVPADMQTRGIKPEECQKVLKLAKTLAAHCGIGEMQLKESPKGGIQRISALYDFDRLSDPEAHSKLLRDMLVETLQSNHPELKGKAADDILSVADVQRAVSAVDQLSPGIVGVGMDPAQFRQSPFAVLTPSEGNAEQAALVPRDSFLLGLAIPELREKSVECIWNKELLQHPSLDPADEAVRMAANASDTGLAITTVMVAGEEGKAEAMHIFRAAPDDDKPESLVVVSGGLDKRLQALLKTGGVTYVDYHDIDAARTVNAVIEQRISDRATQDSLRKSLSAAFLLRNGAPGQEAENIDRRPGDLMTNMKSLPPVAPLSITAVPKRPAA
jgi:hypothetical protein